MNKDGVAKNIENVKRQLENWRTEMVITTEKVDKALDAKDYRRAIHHATGYLEETIDQLPKLWFYTWVPKWAFVGYLIWVI